MTINDIEQMPIEDRARRLIGDMPWITTHMSRADVDDLIEQVTTSMQAAVIQGRHEEREECADMAENNYSAKQIRDKGRKP